MNLFFDTVYFTVSLRRMKRKQALLESNLSEIIRLAGMAKGVKIPPLTTFQFRSAMSQKTQIHKLKNAHCQIKSELLQLI